EGGPVNRKSPLKTPSGRQAKLRANGPGRDVPFAHQIDGQRPRVMRSAHPHKGTLRGFGSWRKGEGTHRDMKRATVGGADPNLAGVGIPDRGRPTVVVLDEDRTPARGKARDRPVAGTLPAEDVKQAPVACIPDAGHAVARAGRDACAVGREG